MLPREKIIKYGAESLTDDELLAIMLGVGTAKKSVFEISKELVLKYGIEKLLNIDYNELSKIEGIGPSKATKLMACFTLAKRCKKKYSKEELTDSKRLYEYIRPDFLFLNYECIMVLFLNCKFKVIDKMFIKGDHLSNIALPSRKIVTEAIRLDAFGVILAHNHPSGDVNPSEEDISSTFVLYQVLGGLNIKLFDHLVVSDEDYYSMSDKKLI